MSAFHRQLLELLEGGVACASATLVAAQGSTPAKSGHRMIVLADGSLHFTMGGGPLEAMVVQDCLELLQSGDNAVRDYRLVPDGPEAVGMVCGGTVRVFIEVHPKAPALLIFGAGHVGAALAEMSRGMGYRRMLADDRPQMLAAAAAAAGGAGLSTFPCDHGYAGVLPPVDSTTSVVVLTRCHRTDTEILARLDGSEVAYLGMIGSRRKAGTVRRELERQGVSRTWLDRLRSPVGLQIGARSPREIAVAILAELLALRSGVTSERLAVPGVLAR